MNVWLSAFFIVALILAEWRPGRIRSGQMSCPVVRPTSKASRALFDV